ncbi:unnamed protein product [Hydatigera taeniaeformis]|uniref:T-box domain-containing protein n=1 Tax=Hydatigena taeniaeformis TaxID=6205 RepID=A0A0R3X5U4_HYDTA|nr:unnamed protein product [Hydatigera taeniaeformis]
MDEYHAWSSQVNGGYEENVNHCLPPIDTQHFANSSNYLHERQLLPDHQMPLEYQESSFNPSSYQPSFQQEAASYLNNANAVINNPHDERNAYLSTQRCELNYNECEYFKPNMNASEYNQNLQVSEPINGVYGLQQDQPFQQYQSQLYGASDTQEATLSVTGSNSLQFDTGLHYTCQTPNSLFNTSQMVNRTEILEEGGYKDSPPTTIEDFGAAGSQSQQASSTLQSGQDQDLYTVLLVIAQGVPKVFPSCLVSQRGQFSSICVAGADFKHPTLGERSTITLRLRDREIWQMIWPHKMEMITSKNGRRIFPTLSISIEGLEVDELYTIFMDLVPKDQFSYRFQSSHWTPHHAHNSPSQSQSSCIYVSRRLREKGSQLMISGVDFTQVKITNNAATAISRKQIFARSMQIYQPRYHVVRHLASKEAVVRQSFVNAWQGNFSPHVEHVGTYIIPETEFVAVTAYRNKHISDAKIEANPYAKAFRNRRRS